MTIEGLEHFTNDDLIAELINRTTFAGVLVWYTSSVKQGEVEHNETQITKSPPLTLQGVVLLLQQGLELAQRWIDEGQ